LKELIVISGKGGTGKTSLVASFACLAQHAVVVDCDVDAADLHLVLDSRIASSEPFKGGNKAWIQAGRCLACGKCAELCRYDAIRMDGPGNGDVSVTYRVATLACEGCGVCFDHCPERAIEFEPAVCGQWYVSHSAFGPLIRARLDVAAENSGKLVAHLRRAARQLATEQQRDLILCDGSPGIGCPVIASITGASLVLFVAEPTRSGVHDFLRVAELARRLGVPGMLAVNKADLNIELTETLEELARQRGIVVGGRVPYDLSVTRALVARQCVVEASDGPAAQAIRHLWDAAVERLGFTRRVETRPPVLVDLSTGA
jgi:MinD superfamily P-loop ATPase